MQLIENDELFRDVARAAEDRLELMTWPSKRVIKAVRAIDGDIIFLGAGGKMGLDAALLAKRAMTEGNLSGEVYAVSGFASESSEDKICRLEAAGVKVIRADLSEPEQLASLPDCQHVVFMAGVKFNTSDRPEVLEAVNVELAKKVAERFAGCRIVVFSSGNVYPLKAPGFEPDESVDPEPVGAYAQSVLGRERAFSSKAAICDSSIVLFRLNYACGVDYGVLYDIGNFVYTGENVPLETAWLNCISQRDANCAALEAFGLCKKGQTEPLNVTGPETVSVIETARWFSHRLGKSLSTEGQGCPYSPSK